MTTKPQTYRIVLLAAATALVLGAALAGALAAPGAAAGPKASFNGFGIYCWCWVGRLKPTGYPRP